MAFKIQEVRAGVFHSWNEAQPRPGPELEAFVADQLAYYKCSEWWIRKAIGDAQHIQRAERRTGNLTIAQEVAESMGEGTAILVQTHLEAMAAVKKRPILDKNGKVQRGENGEILYNETPDHLVRLRGAKQYAELIGANAPKELHIEASHDHTLHVTAEQLRDRIGNVAEYMGLEIVEAAYDVAPADPGGEREIAPAGD